MQCLRLVQAGLNAKGIAAELDLSLETVNAHLKAARRILEVSRSADAARLLAEAEGLQNVGTHPLGIAPPHFQAASAEGNRAIGEAGTGTMASDELREARTPFLDQAMSGAATQVGRRRFDDLTPSRRGVTIVLAMVACVVVVAGLAAIASSLQAMLWAMQSIQH